MGDLKAVRATPRFHTRAHDRIRAIREQVNFANRTLRATDFVDSLVNLTSDQRDKVTSHVMERLSKL